MAPLAWGCRDSLLHARPPQPPSPHSVTETRGGRRAAQPGGEWGLLSPGAGAGGPAAAPRQRRLLPAGERTLQGQRPVPGGPQRAQASASPAGLAWGALPGRESGTALAGPPGAAVLCTPSVRPPSSGPQQWVRLLHAVHVTWGGAGGERSRSRRRGRAGPPPAAAALSSSSGAASGAGRGGGRGTPGAARQKPGGQRRHSSSRLPEPSRRPTPMQPPPPAAGGQPLAWAASPAQPRVQLWKVGASRAQGQERGQCSAPGTAVGGAFCGRGSAPGRAGSKSLPSPRDIVAPKLSKRREVWRAVVRSRRGGGALWLAWASRALMAPVGGGACTCEGEKEGRAPHRAPRRKVPRLGSGVVSGSPSVRAPRGHLQWQRLAPATPECCGGGGAAQAEPS